MIVSRNEPGENYSASWSEISALMRKYWLLVVVVSATCTLACYLTLQIFFTNLYESQTSLLVKVGRENTEVPVTVQKGQVLSQGVRVADINSEVQMLSSRVLLDRVVDSLGADRFQFELKRPDSRWGYPKYYVKCSARWVKKQVKELLIVANIKKRLSSREQAIAALADAVKTEPVKESDVLLLKVRLPEPQLSVQVAQLLVQYYLEERAKARRVPASQDFFLSQLSEIRNRMQQLVKARQDLRNRWNLSSADQQRALLLQQSAELQRQLLNDRSEMAQLLEQRKEMAAALQSQPEFVNKEQVDAENPAIQSIKDRITALQVDHAKTASSYQLDSPLVKRIDEEIAELQATLDREKPTIRSSTTTERNPVTKEFAQEVAQSSVRVGGLESKSNELQLSSQKLRDDLGRLNHGSDDYDAVQREYLIAEQNYLVYARKQEEARIAQELDVRQMQNVSVMSGPDLPIEPVYPRHLLILEFAFPLSLLLGIAVAALWEGIDDRIHDDKSFNKFPEMEFLGSCRVQAWQAGSS